MLRVNVLLFLSSFLIICKGLESDQLTDAARRDIVTNLPGYQKFTFKSYAGYLDGLTDDSQLFYWFMESQSNPQKDPLVLWLNGGPGCSSLMAVLQENGPFTIDGHKKLTNNPYSWNKKANVIYLEAPVGVGFSYSKSKRYKTNDDKTADDNMGALRSFLKKFPQYKGRDFFITGESYGGVYVPTLAKRVLIDKTFNLKAIAIGNGLSSYEKNDNSLIYFAYNHGLISTRFWKKILNHCCQDQDLEQCYFTRNTENMCVYLLQEVQEVLNSGFNIYNLYSPCVGGVSETTNTNKATDPNKKSNLMQLGLSTESHSDNGNLFRNSSYMKVQRYLNSQKNNLRLTIPCTDNTLLPRYFNQYNVKRALHVRPESLRWDVCSSILNEKSYERTYYDMSVHYHFILSKNIPILVYNGDVDMACNYLGDEWFLDNLGLAVKMKYRPWKYTDKLNRRQVGGWTKIYSNGGPSITFATVRGSGHMVPQDKPDAAFYMFSRFLGGRSL